MAAMVDARVWALGLAALPLVACKLKSSTDEPGRDVRSWTLAEIEAELARNDQALAGEGIVVAMATPPAHGEAPPAEPAPTVETETDAIDPGAEDGDEGGDAGAVAQPVAPEPAPVTQPTAAFEAPELTAGEAAPERTSRRRMSSRSRRETATRCDRVCGLAEATCELETQICELATRHPDEPRYAQACQRAEQQCAAASEACNRCEE